MSPETRRRPGRELAAWMADYVGMATALGIIVVIFALTAKNFLTFTTLRTIANQIPTITIVAVGMTYVLVVAGIDLSVGSVLALSSAALGVVLSAGWPLPVAVLAGVACGALCGAVNGLIVVAWGIPSFIVTLGMLEVARGAAYLVTDSKTVYLGRSVEVFALPWLGLLSPAFLIALVIVAGGQFLLSFTVLGRHMIATGTNEEASRLSGIATRRVQLIVFTICGLLTGLASVMHTARMASANPNSGTGFELQAIAAVVIGGTSLMGGRGSVIRTFFGVLIIAVLTAGLAQVGASEPVKRVVTGLVIIAAVVVDHYRHHWSRARRSAGGAS